MGRTTVETTNTNKEYLSRPDCRHLSHIPGNYGLPYFGNSLSTIWGLDRLIEKHFKRYGEVSRMKMLNQRGLLVLGFDNYQRIFLDSEKNFSTEMGFAQSIGQFYRGGLLMKDFSEHKFLRRMMQTAFKNSAMQHYSDMMNPIICNNIEKWDCINRFLFFPEIKKTLLEVGAKVFIGAEAGEETDKMNQAFLAINDGLMAQLRRDIPGTKYHKGKKGEAYLKTYFGRLIDDRRQGSSTDMLSFMCREKDEEGSFYDKNMIIPQASFLLFAAHDTTTSLLNHMVYYSAVYPAWQEQMRSESLALNKKWLDYEDLDKLDGMQKVLFECLRLRPSVSFIERRTINPCQIGGHDVPADTMIFLSPIHNHMDASLWSNPRHFDPERFSSERQEHKIHPFAFHPFGGGAHKCIGMHFAQMLAKSFMHQLLLTYEYSLPENFKPQFEWVPLPKPRKLPVIWKRR